MGANRDAALAYVERGWSVVPIRPKSKNPLVPSWLPYQTARATREQVEEWWTKWPSASVAIVTGAISGVVVLDVDTTHGANPAELYQRYPTGLVARTGSGGAHLYYKYPGQWVPNRTNVYQGVDIRGDGGYVVVPPSIHSTGGQYQWLQEGDPADAPPWFTEAADPDRVEEAKTGSDHWILDLLENGAPEGQRNDACARLSGFLASKQIPLELAYHYIGEWNRKNQPPLKEREWRNTVLSVYRTDWRRRQAREIHTSKSATDTPSKFTVCKWSKYARKHGDVEVRWLVQDWLAAASCVIVGSPPGSYKTWLLLDLAVSVAEGVPFLGKHPTTKGKVLLIQQEDNHFSLVERGQTIIMSRLKLGLPSVVDDEFSLDVPDLDNFNCHEDRALDFESEQSKGLFIEAVRDLKPSLVIVDPLYSTVSTEGFMQSAAKDLFILKNLRDELGTTFVIAHHTRKTGSDTRARDALWGSQFLNAWLETSWNIMPEESGKSIRVNRTHKSAEPPPDVVLTFDIKTKGSDPHYKVIEQLQSEFEGNEVDCPLDPLAPNILRILEEEPMTKNAIARHLGCHHRNVSKSLEKLADQGKVVQLMNKNWQLVSPASTGDLPDL